jgi:Mce-associated membrane protein
MSDPAHGTPRARSRLVVTTAVGGSALIAAIAVFGAVELTSAAASPRSDTAASANSTNAADAASATAAMVEGGQLAVDFTSFNYRTFSTDLTATAKHATPAFAKVYLAQSRTIAPAIKKVKAVAQSRVAATGLQSFSPTKGTASVIVALNETTSNVKSPAGTQVYLRMRVTLVKQGGQWLASGVSPQ